MADIKERKQKNVKFGLTKEENFEVDEDCVPNEDENGFHVARDYWMHMCGNGSPLERKNDLTWHCRC